MPFRKMRKGDIPSLKPQASAVTVTGLDGEKVDRMEVPTWDVAVIIDLPFKF
jgi:hypothetical protein